MKLWIPVVLSILFSSSLAIAEEALFVSGTSMNFRATMEEQNCMDMEGPDWKCDSNGCCNRKSSFKIQCRVKQTVSFGNDKASLVVCSDDHKSKEIDITYPAEGVWFRNKNGLYRFFNVDEMLDAVNVGTEKLVQYRKKKGKKENYLKIAYDMDPFIPAGITSDKVVKVCDPEVEGMCTVVSIRAAQSSWCRTDEMTGGDEAIDLVCIDENKAIPRFEKTFSGGMYFKIVAEQ